MVYFYTQDLLRIILLMKWDIISLKLNTPITIIQSEDRRDEGRTFNNII
jgi:hypothetical protein